jgi:polyisoprenoid-binding protein YceI
MSTETGVKTKWAIDPSHSEIHFKVKHMMVSTVTGAFNDFEGTVETDNEDFEGADVRFSADVNSIHTNNKQRDDHLKSDDFFNAMEYPKMTFESKSFKMVDEDEYELIGDLTIRDNTKEVKLKAIYNGTVVDPYGQTKAGFEIMGKIKRKEFGLKWDAMTEAGGVVVSDDVRMLMNVQLVKKS